jgi:hypothetical protein
VNAKEIYFDQLQEKIKSHPGKSIFDATQVYGVSLNILFGNCNQLRQLICLLEDPKDPAKIMGIDRRSHLQNLFDETNRHLHNFLASITTLVDHTRNLMGESFVKTEHRQEYQMKVEAMFTNDPLAQFLKNFRNYITHYAIPHIGLQHQFSTTGTGIETIQLFIDLDKLEMDFDWSAPGRRFIEQNKPQIQMLKLVDGYEIKARSFTDELMATFRKHCGQELNEIVSLMQESNDFWQTM